MKHIAIIGFGVVGGGIPEVIASCKDGIERVLGEGINVKYILDLREFPDSPYADRVVHDIDVILNDPEIELVAETMGGSHPAYEFTVACMEHGISVVSSNKEVVANFGDKLLECAEKNGVMYLFEASVGGGIPCLRPFASSLGHEHITSVSGILNGTTNFILTKMKTEKRDFAEVLAEAQSLGYAERDPSADINSIDAMRKIIILTALATGKLPSEKTVYAEGITKITPEDIDAADRIGAAVKLVGTYRECGEKMSVYVCPQIVMNDNALSSVNDVYNAISVRCEITGDVMFYGRGAGRYPTAGAVVADAVAVLSGAAATERRNVFVKDDSAVAPFEDVKFSYYIRTALDSPAEALESFSAAFDEVKVIDGAAAGKCEFICGKLTKHELDALLPTLGCVESVIRIFE